MSHAESMFPAKAAALSATGTVAQPVRRWNGQALTAHLDHLAVEGPLELRVRFGSSGDYRPVAVLMRTPGDDVELACGFLSSEGVIRERSDLLDVRVIGSPAAPAHEGATVLLDLAPSLESFPVSERRFLASSSCGVCGRASLENLLEDVPSTPNLDFRVSPRVILQLAEKLAAQQRAFEMTGGLHAVASFTASGDLQASFEDIGRHNALDKLIGAAWLSGKLPLRDHILFSSSRASFDLLQKTVLAGAPVLGTIGAPSSLAVELAQRYQVTLLGFIRGERFNVYSVPQRIAA